MATDVVKQIRPRHYDDAAALYRLCRQEGETVAIEGRK